MRAPFAFFIAAVYFPAFALPAGYEPLEDCGSSPNSPAWYDRALNKSKVATYENYQQCLGRNSDRERRNIERQTAELKAIVFRSHESCRQAIRRVAPQPATLSFDYAKPFSYLSGLNGSGVYRTDGGYSVEVSGSDIQGQFSVKCYMDKSFNVTGVR